MKRLLIIILLLSILLIGCSKTISADTTNTTVNETTTAVITETTINNDYEDLKVEYDKLLDDNSKLKDDIDKYAYLIRNLNNLLKNVYYGYAENDSYENEFTAFSIYHNSKYYLITVGHAIENEYGKFGNFKFKANFTGEWIYPELLIYEKGFHNDNDYAIFYSDKVTNGFMTYDYNLDCRKFILGNTYKNLNVFREYQGNSVIGESGSPIINLNQELLAIYTANFTKIHLVLNAINNLD